MISHLCNRCVHELLILTRTWFAFGLPSKPGVTNKYHHYLGTSGYKQQIFKWRQEDVEKMAAGLPTLPSNLVKGRLIGSVLENQGKLSHVFLLIIPVSKKR
jgi:hypothetical protein